jgi:hypothetical protein
MKRFIFSILCIIFVTPLQAATLKVGHAHCDITPPRPVLVDGHLETKIRSKIRTPLTANVLVLEGGQDTERSSVIFVSFDMIGIRPELDKVVRDAVKRILPEFDDRNLILCATHTHVAPCANGDFYYVPEGTDYMKPAEYLVFLMGKVGPTIEQAWKSRQPAKFSYGLGHAVVAYNRRTVFDNGTAEMYGDTGSPHFRRFEAMEDQDVGTMFFWDEKDKLLAMLVNVSATAQSNLYDDEIEADFWHPARESLKAEFGHDVTIIATVGAAGDVAPRHRYYRAAEDRMRRLRNLSTQEELGRRVVHAVKDSYEPAKSDQQTDVLFRHEYAVLSLPEHQITVAEYESAKAEADALKKQLAANPGLFSRHLWTQRVVDNYERQQQNPHAACDIPIHVLRIGDTAMMTNPFELFTDYGIQMKTRCKAVQTFVVELTGIVDVGYLPTPQAYQHGGYSAIAKSMKIGPDGGQVLVEETLKIANELFGK